MNIVCVISARGGSKGLPKKNIANFLGKPLIAWSIEQALKSKFIHEVYVSTDSKEIANIAIKHGAKIEFMRPTKLADDNAKKWDVWVHAYKELCKINKRDYSIYVDLDCSSPVREPHDIDTIIDKFINSKVDAIFTICESRRNPYFNMVEYDDGKLIISKKTSTEITRRQDAPKVYDHVGSIYVLSGKYLKLGNGLLSGNVVGFDIGQNKGIDIDNEMDFKYAEYLMGMRLKNINSKV